MFVPRFCACINLTRNCQLLYIKWCGTKRPSYNVFSLMFMNNYIQCTIIRILCKCSGCANKNSKLFRLLRHTLRWWRSFTWGIVTLWQVPFSVRFRRARLWSWCPFLFHFLFFFIIVFTFALLNGGKRYVRRIIRLIPENINQTKLKFCILYFKTIKYGYVKHK